MSIPTTVVASAVKPGLFAALASVYGAVISLANLAPQLTQVVSTNVSAVQHLSNAGALYCEDIETASQYEHKTRVLELEAKFRTLELSLNP